MAALIRWRPLAEFDLNAARSMVEHSIHQWRENWFGTRASTLSVDAIRIVQDLDASGIDTGEAAYRCGDALWWSIDKDAPRRLAELALDVRLPTSAKAAPDACAPFTGLGERVMHELSLALAGLSQAVPPTPAHAGERPRQGVIVHISADDGHVLCTALCAAPLMLERSRVPPTKRTPRATKLVSRRAALASTHVRLNVSLGQASLPVRQLVDLSAGDVIRLGRKLDEGVELFIDAATSTRRSPFGAARLIGSRDRIAIQFELKAEQALT